jgi:hypothetical protein
MNSLMPVYVDSYNAAFGRMVMCHMMADSTAELLAMVDKIGVARKWIQKAGTPWEHFDIYLSKKAKAIVAGAIEVTAMDLARMSMARMDAIRAASAHPEQGPTRRPDGRSVSSHKESSE